MILPCVWVETAQAKRPVLGTQLNLVVCKAILQRYLTVLIFAYFTYMIGEKKMSTSKEEENAKAVIVIKDMTLKVLTSIKAITRETLTEGLEKIPQEMHMNSCAALFGAIGIDFAAMSLFLIGGNVPMEHIFEGIKDRYNMLSESLTEESLKDFSTSFFDNFKEG